MSNPIPTSKDFFISYTGQDRSWAEWIGWVLEEAGYTVVIQAWDFRVGGNFVLDMQKAAIEARRTLAVLSSLYLEKPFPQSEWTAAFAQDPTSTERQLIPVRVENCNPPGLLAQIVYIDVFDCEETEAQQRLLCAVTDGRMKPAERPRFPGKGLERIVPNHVPFPGTDENASSSIAPVQIMPNKKQSRGMSRAKQRQIEGLGAELEKLDKDYTDVDEKKRRESNPQERNNLDLQIKAIGNKMEEIEQQLNKLKNGDE